MTPIVRIPYLLIFLLGVLLSACDVLDEQSFTVSGSEVSFAVAEQFESNTFTVSQTVANPDFAAKLKERGLPTSMLTSLRFASLTLRVASEDPEFTLGSISDLKVTMAAEGGTPLTVASGSFEGWDGDEALLTVGDVELLDFWDSPTLDYRLTFTVTDLPRQPVDVEIDPKFTVTTSVFN